MIYTATFTIERLYRHAPAKVFRAFANPEAKQQWFVGPKDAWQERERVDDFRVGGSDRLRGVHKTGLESLFVSRYHEIVPNRRIVYVYDMHVDGALISVSLATIELEEKDGGTRLVITEQGAYLEGGEQAYRSRVEGTEQLIRALDAMMNAS
jgi:uncharacterized protein YndB with AHSA1/START domain